MKVDYKIDGDKLVITASHEAGLDADKDGMQSLSVKADIVVVADGSEILDELVKSNSFVEKIKAKLGL